MSFNEKSLPVSEHLEQVVQSIQDTKVTIVTASPGSGKTLLIPPHLLKNTSLRIAMLQPRRVAARLCAQSIAEFNGWKVGEEVGLIMKDVSQKSAKTRLTVMTEGVLSRMLSSESRIDQFDLIILDEFHERSIHTDLACAWLKKQSRVKLLVMSATLDIKPLMDYFGGASLIEVEGRAFPVEPHYLKQSISYHDVREFDEKLLDLCEYSLESHKEGNVLVFLPGSRQIQRIGQGLKDRGVPSKYSVEIHSLYSRAQKEDQQKAVADSPSRKIILSTNIAETSLTLPKIKVVIDSGLKKESSYNTKTGVQSLSLQRVALDSATQRAGRAGRLSPGDCYKMWTKANEQRFRKATPAEIHRIDPVDYMLKVFSFGEQVENFEFLEPPKPTQLHLSLKRLEIAGCVVNHEITSLGRWVSQFPGDFSLGLLAALSLGKDFFEDSLLAIVILQEGDPAPFLSKEGSGEEVDDLKKRLSWLKDNTQHYYHKLAKKLKSRWAYSSSSSFFNENIQSLDEALCLAFTHRLCRVRGGKKSSAIMSTGRGVKFSGKRSKASSEFFIALDLIDHQLHGQLESEVKFSTNIKRKTIKKVYSQYIEEKTEIKTSKKKNEAPKAYVYQRFWELPLEEPRGVSLDRTHIISDIKQKLVDNPCLYFDGLKESLSFLERFLFCRKNAVDMDWPEFAEEDWELVVDAAFSETDSTELSDQEWLRAIQMMFSEAQIDFMNSFAPLSISTSKRKDNWINYQDPMKPKVSMVLQEAFEIKESPKIGNGSIVLGIELLAPSRRPIEVSTDMKRFWEFSYPDIRKQYRGRYPKHKWPEEVK